MNELLLTYDDIKKLYYDDAIDSLSQKTKDHLQRALRCWYCTTDFDQMNIITGINPMDWNDEDNSRNEMITQASKVWNGMELSLQLYHFIQLCDAENELKKYIDN